MVGTSIVKKVLGTSAALMVGFVVLVLSIMAAVNPLVVSPH